MGNATFAKLRKQYGELSPDERVRLINAADVRGDADEIRALMESAPRIGWGVYHHYGIRSALTDLEIAMALSLCHLSAELFRCMFLRFSLIGEVDEVQEGDMATLGYLLQRGEILDECIVLFSRSLLAHRAAWQELAGEWSFDWQDVVNSFDVIGPALIAAEKQADDESIDPVPVLVELRRFIEVTRSEWE